MTKQDPILSLKSVDVTFQTGKQTIRAVQDVTLDIQKGDIFGIIGYSGAGKSTLVRTMNLLQRPTGGEVFFENRNLLKLAPKALREERKKIGMIFQHFNLMASRTAAENVAYALRKSLMSPEKKRQKVLDLLDLVGLKERANAYPSQLSGGQKQRVAIARALANDPQVLLCDEATSALDPKTTLSILRLLKQLSENLSLTIVLITHEMMAVKEICNRVAVMENGHVIEEGALIDLFTDPQAQVTREFIDTTSQADQTIHTLLGKENLLHSDSDEVLVRLSYKGEEKTTDLVRNLASQFQVTVDILSGNIEYIQEVPVGDLFVRLSATEKDAITDGLNFLERDGFRVKRIKTAAGSNEDLASRKEV